MPGAHWDDKEDAYLTFQWGIQHTNEIAKHLGRPPRGVLDRSKKLELGPPSRGTWCLGEVAKELGISNGTVKVMMQELGMSMTHALNADPRFAKRKHQLSLDIEDVEKITTYYEERKTKTWGVRGRPEACVVCKDPSKPYHANNLCHPCYERSRQPPTNNGGRKRAYGHDPVLNPSVVMEMRMERNDDVSFRRIGLLHGVSKKAASMAVQGQSWKDLPQPRRWPLENAMGKTGDPVFIKDGKWWFYAEDWAHEHGPFFTRGDAAIGASIYAECQLEALPIDSFSGIYRFLSNFVDSEVTLDGVVYPTVEHAYQAAKTTPEHRSKFAGLTSAQAKKLGRTVPLRPDWEEQKLLVMQDLVSMKFLRHKTLRRWLDLTGNVQITEGNTWGDIFWGVCGGVGENHLGMIIMKAREGNRKT